VSGRIRVEVTDEYGVIAEILTPGEPPLRPRQRDRLGTLAEGLVRDLAQILGTDEHYARQVAVTELMRLRADEAAYERVAARKGLLPL
jgi:hypothetical protein